MNGLNAKNKMRIMSALLIILLILGMIFFGSPLVKMGASARILTVSMKGDQALDMKMIFGAAHIGFLTTLINILYIASMALALIPLITGKFRRGFFVISKIAPIVTLLLFSFLMIVVLVALGQENSDLGQDVYRMRLTLQAYIYLLSTILALILSFVISRFIKKLPKEETPE